MPRKHREHLFGPERKSKRHFLKVLYLSLFLPFVPQAGGYFMSNSKAVLQGCSDHWTLQDRWAMPLLFQMTVCVDVRVMTPGEWTAFSYTSPRSPYYDLALQGDDSALYAWLLGVRHRFPGQLAVGRWYRLCLRRDAQRDSFSLEVSGNPGPEERTVIARTNPPTGTLLLGCQPRDASPGARQATVELYLFRVWNDVLAHGTCEDGTVVGWDSRLWAITRSQAMVRDDTLKCGMFSLLGHLRVKRDAVQATRVMTSVNARDFSSSAAPFLSTLALFTSTVNSPQQQASITTTPGTATPSTTTAATSSILPSATMRTTPTTPSAAATTMPATSLSTATLATATITPTPTTNTATSTYAAPPTTFATFTPTSTSTTSTATTNISPATISTGTSFSTPPLPVMSSNIMSASAATLIDKNIASATTTTTPTTTTSLGITPTATTTSLPTRTSSDHTTTFSAAAATTDTTAPKRPNITATVTSQSTPITAALSNMSATLTTATIDTIPTSTTTTTTLATNAATISIPTTIVPTTNPPMASFTAAIATTITSHNTLITTATTIPTSATPHTTTSNPTTIITTTSSAVAPTSSPNTNQTTSAVPSNIIPIPTTITPTDSTAATTTDTKTSTTANSIPTFTITHSPTTAASSITASKPTTIVTTDYSVSATTAAIATSRTTSSANISAMVSSRPMVVTSSTITSSPTAIIVNTDAALAPTAATGITSTTSTTNTATTTSTILHTTGVPTNITFTPFSVVTTTDITSATVAATTTSSSTTAAKSTATSTPAHSTTMSSPTTKNTSTDNTIATKSAITATTSINITTPDASQLIATTHSVSTSSPHTLVTNINNTVVPNISQVGTTTITSPTTTPTTTHPPTVVIPNSTASTDAAMAASTNTTTTVTITTAAAAIKTTAPPTTAAATTTTTSTSTDRVTAMSTTAASIAFTNNPPEPMQSSSMTVFSSTGISQSTQHSSPRSSLAYTSTLRSRTPTVASTGDSEKSAINTTVHPTTASFSDINLSLTTLTPTTLTVNRTNLQLASTLNTSSTDSPVSVQCNLSQFCDNKAPYYWMFVGVEVQQSGTNKSQQDVKDWFSELFMPTCSVGGATTGTANISMLCQNNSAVTLQVISMDCEPITDFRQTNCAVMIQLNQTTDTCTMKQLLQQKNQASDLLVELLGDVARMGKNTCIDENMLTPGFVFVTCNSSLPSPESCAAEASVSATCSYANTSFIPYDLNKASVQSCDNDTQYSCDCSSFCRESGAFYGFSLNISRHNVTFNDVTNTIAQLDCHCNSSLLPSLCNVSSQYQGVHIQCHGDGTRLYSCLVALQLRQSLDVCIVSEALAALLQSSTFITYDGTLTRLALCGLPSDGASLLNSNLTWGSANIGAKQICTLNKPSLTTQFTCDKGQVLSVLLNESCTVPPFKFSANPSQMPYMTCSPSELTTGSPTSTIIPSNSAGTHIGPAATPFNTAATSSKSVTTSVSGTAIRPSDTATSPNTTGTLSSAVAPVTATITTPHSVVTPFNTTSTPSNYVVTSVNSAVHESNGTVSSQKTAITTSNTATPILTTVTPANITHSLLDPSIPPYSTNTTISTQLLLNTTTPQYSITQHITTPETETTQFSTSLSENTTYFSTVQTTHYNVTDLSQNISHSNTSARDLNTTLPNITAPPLNSILYNTATTLNATTFSTAEHSLNTPHTETTTNVNVTVNITNLNMASTSNNRKDHQNTTAPVNTTDKTDGLLYTVNVTSPNTTPPKSTNPNTATSPPYMSFYYMTQSNTSGILTNAATSMNATRPNTTPPTITPLGTATLPLFYNMSQSNITVNFTNAATSIIVTSPNTTRPSTTGPITTTSPLYTSFNNTKSNSTANSTNAATPINPNTLRPSTTISSPFNNVTESNSIINSTTPTASIHMTVSNTTSPIIYTTGHQNGTTGNITYPNITSSQLYTANTSSAANTTLLSFYTSSLNNITVTSTPVYVKNTTAFMNVTLQNTTGPSLYTTENSTSQLFYTTGNTSSPNTTMTQNSTTVQQFNFTVSNKTLIPLNSTAINTTVPQNATQFNEIKTNDTQFNNTTPAPITARINTTFTTDVNLDQNITASDLHTTQFDTTSMRHSTTLNITNIYNVTSGIIPVTVNTTNNEHESSPVINITSTQSTTGTRYSTTSSPGSLSENQLNTTQPSLTTTGMVQSIPNATGATVPGIQSTTADGGPALPKTTVQTTIINTTTTTTMAATTTTAIANTTTTSSDAFASQLLNETLNQNPSALNSSQVQNLVSDLENVLDATNISLDLGQKVLSVVDHLLNSPASALTPSSSNRLIKVVDTLGMKLIIPGKTESITVGSLALMVTKIDGTNFLGTSFSISDPMSLVVKGRRRRSVSSQLGSITLPASLTENLTQNERLQASRLQFTFFNKTTLFQDVNKTLLLNSLVLGTSVANLSIKGLRQNVEFTLKNEKSNTGYRSCVFWDFEKNGGKGGWSDVGCIVMNTSTENETVCGCNHLTSFAVLMDLSRGGSIDSVQGTILTFITYIGCGISAIFLAITLLSYLAFEKIRRDIPSKILINLCFALLFLNMIFLLDSWLAMYPSAVGLCISTAFFLHYFLLACFTWMGLESLHLYLAIVKVFNSTSRYMLKFVLVGWSVPLVVVIIVIAVSKDNYGVVQYSKYSDGTSDDFCWLKNDIAFYVGVVAYFCGIFAFNLIMFVVVMVQLRRIKRQNPHNNQYRSGMQDLRSIAGLTFLLGLTWGFAFFAWGPVNLAFMYLFTIFNSLQGFFIFVFHCAMKETVRRQWRTYLCCGKYRLAENSDWSRTATQKTKKTSLATANSSHRSQQQSASRSSSLSTNSIPQSDIMNFSSENSLSTSVEDSNGDVVLNEINSQHTMLHRTD